FPRLRCGRVRRLAAEQLAEERGARGERYDEQLLQPDQGGEQHLEEPCLRGDAAGDQRGDRVFRDLVGTRDEVGVAVPLVELDEAHHLAHRPLDRLELVRSEERRVGKECRARWGAYQLRTEM